MITTKQINVDLEKGQAKLKQKTTKDIDASIKVEHPKEPVKQTSISTRNLSDVANIIEKRRRDDIAAESKVKKADEKELKKLNMQFVFVDVDDLIQGVVRRELK